jgi:hypothetical protein
MNKKQPTAQWMNRTPDETGTFAQRFVNWFRDTIGPRRTESVRPVRSKPMFVKDIREDELVVKRRSARVRRG